MNFRRNQVSWTVARILSEDPSPAFERDIAMKVQRLIDRDRATETASSHTARAFLEEDGPGKGTVVEFSEEAVFLLLLGVLFLESGLTQSRVIRLIRDLRTELCEHQQWILTFVPASLKGQRTDAAWKRDIERRHFANDKGHLTYLVASGNLADPDGEMTHRLCRKHEQMAETVGALSLGSGPVIVIELTNRVLQTRDWLSKAPRITRGRRSTT